MATVEDMKYCLKTQADKCRAHKCETEERGNRKRRCKGGEGGKGRGGGKRERQRERVEDKRPNKKGVKTTFESELIWKPQMSLNTYK